MDEQHNNELLQVENPAAETPPAADEIHYPSGMVLPAPAQEPQERYPRRRAAGRDLGLAAILLLFCFLFWDSICWAVGLGLGEALGLAGLLPAALWYLRGRPGRLTGYGLICAGLYLLGAVSLVFSGDGVLKVLTIFALVPLFLIVILERLGLRTGHSLRARISDHWYLLFQMGFGRFPTGSWALTHAGPEDSVRSKRARAMLLGLLCAIPALMILFPLLISSDAAFAGLMGRFDLRMLGRFLLALCIGGILALLIFSLLFTSDRGPKPLQAVARKGLEPVAVAAFLAAVSAIYLLYLAAQFAYFTDAFKGLLPKDFTVAQYARRGFLEMCAIVAINLGLIVLAVGLCRKDGGKVPGAVKGLSLFLCIFSLGLVATALSKMVLYMGSFGLTRLRILTSVFMVFLAVIVIAEAVKLFVGRLQVIRLAVVLGAVLLIALSLSNVDGQVARYNVEAWRSGRLDSLDMDTVCCLDDGATPIFVELSQESDQKIAERAKKELARRKPNEDLRSWNLIGRQANEALKEYQSR